MTYCPKRRPDLITREIEEEILIYDPLSQEVFLLNSMAAVVWEMCDGGNSQEEIAEEIAKTLSAASEQVTADVEGIVSDFFQKGILEKSDPKKDGC